VTAPSVPANLRVAAATADGLSLAWDASVDDVGVAGYELFLDGAEVGSTTATSYLFSGLACGSSHTLAVVAFDAAGNWSEPASLVAATAACPLPAGPPAGFTHLAFADEFDGAAGSKPSSALWGFKSYWDNWSIAYFDGANQIAEDGAGNLVITAARQPDGSWRSGMLSSAVGVAGPFAYEARVQVAPGYGMWSGIWSWPFPWGQACGEIDAVEQLGRQPTGGNQSLHSCNGSLTRYADTGGVLADGFHVYAAYVYADRVDFYIDGILTNTETPADVGGDWPFLQNTAFNISLSVGACGSWAGCPPADAPATTSMRVDWFRVYTP
jgi:beta-glucanase (GH16 family)